MVGLTDVLRIALSFRLQEGAFATFVLQVFKLVQHTQKNTSNHRGEAIEVKNRIAQN